MWILRLLLTGLALAFLSPLSAQDKPAVRAEVGKPIQAAVELLKGRRGKEALARAREAQAVSGKSAYETLIVDQVIGQAAAAAGEASTAARAFEAAAGNSAAPESQRRQFLAAAAGQYYVARDYGKAADVSGKYMREGGADRAVRAIHAQALYLSNNFAAAAKALAAEIETDERAGRAPTEDQLQLLANAYLQQRESAGYARTLERLVAHYPKKDYWLSLLHAIVTRPGYSEKLAVDVARLKLATGTLRTATEYIEAAQLSLQDGFPMEATKVIEQGYAAGLLGSGAEAERHKRLKDMAAKNLAEDRKSLAQEENSSGDAKDGKALLNEGFNYVLHGNAGKGLAMMEKGLKLGTGFRRPEHAKLQMAHAYHLAGQNKKAIQTYRTVQGADGAASIARLWALHLSRNGSG